MTSIRCYACRIFFPKAQRVCPECGSPTRPVNVALESQRWRSHLNMQAEHAVKHT